MEGYEEQFWGNENPESQVNATRMTHIEKGIKNAYNVSLTAITSIEPSECNEGDKYFNTSDNLIYTATDTDTWSETGETPISDKTYILTSNGSTYSYNGTTLVRFGGGTGEIPIGGSSDYWGTTDPNENWMIMNGRAISRTEYSELFAIIGTSCGEGDGSTTFNIPKVDGRTTIGVDTTDTDFNAVGKTYGEKNHKLTGAEMPTHYHDRIRSLNGNQFLGRGTGSKNNVVGTTFNTGQYDYTDAENNNYVTGTAGGDGAHNNVQPSIVCNKIIRVK